MKNYINKTRGYIIKHKIISIIALIIIISIGYWIIKSFNNTSDGVSYTTGLVKRETIITSVSGTGQVSALNRVDLKTKASGDLTYLNVKVGQEVQKWSHLAQIDSGDVSYELESAKIAYDELITIDPNDLRKAENNVFDTKKDIETAYANARISIIKASTDLSDNLEIINDLLNNYLYSSKTGLSNTSKEYIRNVESKYYVAYRALNTYLKNYRMISDISDQITTESLLNDLSKIADQTLEASKSAKDTVIYLREREDDPAVALNAYTTANNLVISVNTIVTNLSSANDNIIKSNRAFKEAEIALADLKSGPSILSLRSQELSLKQKQEALANYSVTAPFAGVIASVADLNVGDTVSNGTTIATLITKQKIAEISLNEIDAAKVKVGQKANLTFDAFDNLNIVGTVAEVNLIGTVSQGVVSYTIKISFDTQDDRVKSGMSVSASIITEVKTDVLTVANSAIKTQGDLNYVDLPAQSGMPGLSPTDLPTQQIVTIGISNDTVTEIISGLKEGDSVITRTTTGSITQVNNRTPTVTNILGGSSRMIR